MAPSTIQLGTNVRHTTKTQKSFIGAVRQYPQTKTAVGAKLVQMLRAGYPPPLLCNSDIMGKSALMRRLQQSLASRGVEIAQQETGTLIGNLARTIEVGEKAQQAIVLAAEYQQSVICRSKSITVQLLASTCQGTSLVGSKEKDSYYITVKFKEDSKKFSDALGES